MQNFELSDGAFTTYDEEWLPRHVADAVLQTLTNEASWEQRPINMFGREIMQPRLISWAGDLPYRYSGQTLPPRAMTPVLEALTLRVQQVVGKPFNHVLLNRYRDGQDCMGMHADDEGELGRNPVIAALSLGVERDFVLAPREHRRRKEKKRFALRHGSLLVMAGTIQHSWRHGVPRMNGVQGERINVTWRWLKGPPGWRDAAFAKSGRSRSAR